MRLLSAIVYVLYLLTGEEDPEPGVQPANITIIKEARNDRSGTQAA